MINEEIKILNNLAHYTDQTNKTRIVIGDTYTYGMSHLDLFHNPRNVEKKCPNFSITRKGEIYKHFNLSNYSDYLDINPKFNITIALENVSILKEINNEYFDIYNNKYEGEVYSRKWKTIEHWIPYTKSQFDSLIYLLVDLKEKVDFSENQIKESNVFDSKHGKILGVGYRSNFNKVFLDPNPSLNFKNLKQTLISEIK